MDAKKQMMILNGEIKTAKVKSCLYNTVTQKMDVEFQDGKISSYEFSSVEWLSKPEVLNPDKYRISRNERELFNIAEIYVFKGEKETYWHICFQNGSERDYLQSELTISESCLTQKEAEDVFRYIKQIADLSNLKNEETGEKMLAKKFAKISFVDTNTGLAVYLNPSKEGMYKIRNDYVPIFPFGCNNSQYQAVKNAMENQISVIQGPPGTGKTQTILNIIANILMEQKTVAVVSNNNSATENVYEKLSFPKYGLDFIAATLGNSENKRQFISTQSGEYPDFSMWKLVEEKDLKKDIYEKSNYLRNVFDKQEELAKLRQEQSQLATEITYFEQYLDESNVSIDEIKEKRNLTGKQWMDLWQESQIALEVKGKIGFWFRLKGILKYGIRGLYGKDIATIITTFQVKYYTARKKELEQKIKELEAELQSVNKGLIEDLCEQSMAVLKDELANRYEKGTSRVIFKEDDLWKNSDNVLKEYPVILSTTFSARNSLNASVIYDYLIMDEASQVDIATGALALSCARNVIIVGDTKQLPNVVSGKDKEKANAVFESFQIKEGYRFTKSFLQSILEILPDVPQTMLREHYRCHPKIIHFCNQKFYRGELLIMTEDKGEEDVLVAVKTVRGNHVREHYSQRQIDVIREEIIPKYITNREETGIITPYKNQVWALKKEIKDIDTATVHKFQGKEKDTIILSTVDDEITDFTDDPYLVNVAISRAKKRLILVVTGNEQKNERNIIDLIEYIRYHNFEVSESKIYSVFDYLYKQYTEARKLYLQNHKKISEYDSENLMYGLLEEILALEKYSCLDVVCHFPLNMLIRNPELLSEKECRFAMNPATHIDFLLFNRISKKSILAIETDGYDYHREDKAQASRDRQKDHILELYHIPLLRFKTNGSQEKEKIIEVLDRILLIK